MAPLLFNLVIPRLTFSQDIERQHLAPGERKTNLGTRRQSHSSARLNWEQEAGFASFLGGRGGREIEDRGDSAGGGGGGRRSGRKEGKLHHWS